jgi:two-component system heavy metal sensor histidine kinase CusS
MLDRLADGYERVSQFSADLAHEIRTPVGVLIGQTQVTLAQDRSAEEYQAVLESNLEELERVGRIAENILFLAQADHDGFAIDTAPLDLAQELATVAEYFEGLAQERELRFEIEASGTVQANAMLWRRAISNLVVNAVRYADAGTVIRLQGHAVQGGAAIDVENQGAPIAPLQLERFFDRFYRGDAARSASTESNGLGLAIVKAIMVLHGGSAAVSCSALGAIRFTLQFPGAVALH